MSDIHFQISEHAYKALEHLQLWHGLHSHSELISYLAKKNLNLESVEVPEEKPSQQENDETDTPLNDIIKNVHPSDLHHTKPTKAKIGNFEIGKCSWQDVMFETIRRLVGKGITPRVIVNTMTITATIDNSLDPSYPQEKLSNIRYNPQATPRLWEEVRILSEAFDLFVEVHFRWTDNKKAAYPRRRGIVTSKAPLESGNHNTGTIVQKIKKPDKELVNVPENINSENSHILSDKQFLKRSYVTNAFIDNRFIKSVTWIEILKVFLVVLAEKSSFTTRELIDEVELPIDEGEIDKEYYSFIQGLDCSVKYSTATEIGSELIRLGNKFNIPVEVHLRWQDEDGSKFPNKRSIVMADKANDRPHKY